MECIYLRDRRGGKKAGKALTVFGGTKVLKIKLAYFFLPKLWENPGQKKTCG